MKLCILDDDGKLYEISELTRSRPAVLARRATEFHSRICETMDAILHKLDRRIVPIGRLVLVHTDVDSRST